MTEIVPGISIVAVILANCSPLPLAQVRSPLPPRNILSARFLQSFSFPVLNIHRHFLPLLDAKPARKVRPRSPYRYWPFVQYPALNRKLQCLADAGLLRAAKVVFTVFRSSEASPQRCYGGELLEGRSASGSRKEHCRWIARRCRIVQGGRRRTFSP